jgi:hypothetical protein
VHKRVKIRFAKKIKRIIRKLGDRRDEVYLVGIDALGLPDDSATFDYFFDNTDDAESLWGKK